MKKPTAKQITSFRKTVYNYYRKQGRSHLPWRKTHDPYKILVSEVMLQQTQVDRVIPKYEAWIKAFPDFKSLAQASTSKILKHWSGLGYNRRALYLKRIAETVRTENFLPQQLENFEFLNTLPGIGPATASSILVYAFNLPYPFIETNVRAVYLHHFFKDKKAVPDTDLWPIVEATLDKKNPRLWYWALMDYSIYIKKTFKNPARQSAHHVKQSKFEGSNRQVRGKIIKLVLEKPGVTVASVPKLLDLPKQKVEPILAQLINEKFLLLRSGKLFFQD